MTIKTTNNTKERAALSSTFHDYVTPRSYISPEEYLVSNQKYNSFDSNELNNLIGHSILSSDIFLSFCNIDGCEAEIEKTDGSYVYCNAHSPDDSVPIEHDISLKCRCCSKIAQYIDFEYCLSKEIRESVYIQNKVTLLPFEESFSFKSRNIFVCKDCAKSEDWNFNNLSKWIVNINSIIDLINGDAEIASKAVKRISETTKGIQLFSYRRDYADTLINDAKSPNASALGELINEDLDHFCKNYAEYREDSHPVVSRLISAPDSVTECSINSALVQRVERIKRIYEDQIVSLNMINNECSDLVIFSNFYLGHIIPVFREVLSTDSSDSLKLLIVAWFCVNYGFFGTYALNRLPELIPDFIMRGRNPS